MLRNLNKLFVLSENLFSVEIRVSLCYDKDVKEKSGKVGLHENRTCR